MTQNELFKRSVSEIIVQDEFEKKLKSGKKLRIKMGFDPTKPDLHLGHLVGLRILKKLQEAGHTIIFLIGDYTAKIGDPSGRNRARPPLTDAEIKKNAETYFSQVSQILDIEKAEIVTNSTWLNKLNFGDLTDIASKFTVAQIIERDDFQKRLKENNDIALHEILYPLMQAYDSVMVKADVEVGGTDQKFNMLAGRALQKKMGQTPQDIITVELLVGLDGKNKMSKSLGNYIALNDKAEEMYGKIMSIPDSQIVEYFKLCTDVEDKAIEVIEKELESSSKNPRDIKAELAKLITEMYHGAEDAEKAAGEFERIFSKGGAPKEIEDIKLDIAKSRLDELLVDLKIVSSKSESRRLIEQGAVEIDNTKITEPEKNIEINDKMIVKVGKRRFVRIKK